LGRVWSLVCAVGDDGKDGLMKIFQYNPALVLVDLRMLGINGIQGRQILFLKEYMYKDQYRQF
jgi:YesN/AraC family two-component response regulator